MRRFFSYGPLNSKRHYYAPREELIERSYIRLVGEYPDEDGHYITVWAPRQCGKTWVMQEVVEKIKKTGQYEVGILTMEKAKKVKKEKDILKVFTGELAEVFQVKFPPIKTFDQIPMLFTASHFQKSVILIIDEFDALQEEFINDFASIFRYISIKRTNEKNKKSQEKAYLLHGMALVGVRSVLGIENDTGSPFNVQRSLHIPNLTYDEVKNMFHWYEKDSGQKVEKQVIDRLFDETRGQPGLTCWLAELLTESYNEAKDKPIGMDNFEEVYAAAVKILPNNNILNIISKANKKEYQPTVLQLFRTDRKIEFTYDNKELNYLYLHGVIDREKENQTQYYVKFSSPFVQKRLFNYFSSNIFSDLGQLTEPLANLEKVITSTHLDIRELMGLYQTYLQKNKSWLFKDVPRRFDLRVYEAVFHFNLYAYLNEFFRDRMGRVLPEFPTGNGKIDLLIQYQGKTYGIEIKSFTHHAGYQQALPRTAKYGHQLGLEEIYLVSFLDSIDEKTRKIYETDFHDPQTSVTVKPIFIQTGDV